MSSTITRCVAWMLYATALFFTTALLFTPVADAGVMGPSGKGSVTVTPISLIKSFTDDPVPPGGIVTLEFMVANRDRDFSATNIAFSDNLTATLAGLVATGLPASDVCGIGSTLSGTGTISLAGGNLPAEGSCTFSVTIQVPVAAVPGAYFNTTSMVTADVGGSPVAGSAATETLSVASVPLLTKTFLDNPVTAGGSTRLEFTITNTSSTSMATDTAFTDELTTILPLPLSVVLPATPCGAGSSMGFTFPGVDRQAVSLTGGILGVGLSCTFEVLVNIPLDQAPGVLTNTTSDITATVDFATATGGPATDSLQVVAAPALRKEFTDDPVRPGSTVTLEYTLINSTASPTDATAIAFTDDLDATLSGLVATGLPMNDVCGAGSQISGTGTLSFTGGTLAPGASCSFSVTLQVPAGAPTGSFNNTTSNVTAMVSGLPVMGQGGTGPLVVSSIAFTKAFTDDPVVPGGTVNLEFTIDNIGTLDAGLISFTDILSNVVSDLEATSLPTDPCGVGSSITGTSSLTFTGVTLPAGTSCTFSLTLVVPAGAPSGTFANTTSSLSTTIGTVPPAIDNLVIDSNLLFLTKTFADDPVDPGGTVTLEFTLQNLDLNQAASGITFSDDLLAVLTGLTATGLPINEVCGGGSQIAGTNVISLTGGNLPAGGSCTWSVNVDVPAGAPAGATLNSTTSSVTGTINGLPVTGEPATDDLRINNLVAFSKAFGGAAVPGGTVMLSFTFDNQSGATVNGLAFADDLDAVLPGLVATGLPLADVCGAGSQLSGTSLLSFRAGSLGPFSSCTIDVLVMIPAGASTGSFLNTTSDLFTGPVVVAAPATSSLVIVSAPLFSKSFAPATVNVSEVSVLTFTIDNSANVSDTTGLDFTDVLPAGTEVANPDNAMNGCTGGTLTAVPGTSTIRYTGGTVSAGGVCTLSVEIAATAAGAAVNVTGDFVSSAGTSGSATASLVIISAPLFSKSFAPATVNVGEVSVLTFTIDNSANVSDTTGLDFTDVLPAGTEVANPDNAMNGCTGGTLTAVPGTSTIRYTGGTVSAGGVCTLSVEIAATAAGAAVNVTGDLVSSAGTSGSAMASLTIASGAVPAPIPTLGTLGILLFGGLLSLFGARRLRRR